MSSFKAISIPFRVLAVVYVLALSASAQAGGCRGATVAGKVRCANIVVEYRDISTDRLEGKIEWPGREPVRVEVYKIKRSDRKKDSYTLTGDYEPLLIFETDSEGRFCYPGLSDGYYVLRIGTTDGGWNCTWIKVQIKKGLPSRKIRASVEIGI